VVLWHCWVNGREGIGDGDRGSLVEGRWSCEIHKLFIRKEERKRKEEGKGKGRKRIKYPNNKQKNPNVERRKEKEGKGRERKGKEMHKIPQINK
jgi:hypothetical protein